MASWISSHVMALDEAEPAGIEAMAKVGGRYWRVTNSISEKWPETQPFVHSYAETLRDLDLHRDPDLSELLRTDPAECLWVDIETTALSDAPLFLIGTMHYSCRDFVLRQYFARTLEEERAVIAEALDEIRQYSLLISFNGKKFDMPYIRDRADHHRINYREPARHLDMLEVSRKRWRGRYPNCKLQTLESCLCGRTRVGDIPGQMIPTAYYEFVRNRDATKIRIVLQHNAMDVLTLAELALIASKESASSPIHP